MKSQLNLIAVRLRHLVFYISLVLSLVSFSEISTAAEKLLVFAAASAAAPLQEIANLFEQETGNSVEISFAGSSTLARQIEAGAPAHLFLSANSDWISYLQKNGLVSAKGSQAILSNSLVLISSRENLRPNAPFVFDDLPERLGDGRLAIGDPDHVPAGIYAKQALVSLGIWEKVRNRLAPQNNVKNALFLVARNESPFGIVYKTDALIEPAVKIIAAFPASSHDDIKYVLARTRNFGSDHHTQFERFLRSNEAISVFEKYGFSKLSN